MYLQKTLLLAGALVLTAAAQAQFTETEPNDSKATSNVFSVAPGSTVVGNTTGSSTATAGTTSIDEYRLNFGASAPAIYRNQIALTTTGTAGHTGSIRSLSQTAGSINAGTDLAFQVSTAATGRINQFYSFGAATSLYYRVAGTTATTGDYTATLSQTAILPTDLGSFATGSITFASTGITTGTTRVDTSVLILDSNFNPIANYSNEDTSGSDFGSTLTRTYAAGTYYLAISNFSIASNQAAATDDGFKTDPVLDFAGVVGNTSATVGTNLNFNVTDANGTQSITSTKAAAFDVNFYRFTVGTPAVPEPASMAALGLGVVALFKRRRKSA